jgi:hypothetical protein
MREHFDRRVVEPADVVIELREALRIEIGYALR